MDMNMSQLPEIVEPGVLQPMVSQIVRQDSGTEQEQQYWVRKIPWERKWQPTPVFLPRKSHGQRSLGGYSPWGCKESDTS